MDLEKELKKWREKRTQPLPAQKDSKTPAEVVRGRRSVRVNGQEVVIVKKRRKAAS